MTVRELMEKLSTLNPDTKIFTSTMDASDFNVTLELEADDIYMEDEISGDNVCDDFEDQFDGEGEYIGEPVLVLHLEY
jgi:hypothetical protein